MLLPPLPCQNVLYAVLPPVGDRGCTGNVVAFETPVHFLQHLRVVSVAGKHRMADEHALLLKHERYEYLSQPADAAALAPSETNDEPAERAFEFKDCRVDVYALKAVAEQLNYPPVHYSFPLSVLSGCR